MTPIIDIRLVPVLISTVLSFSLGFLWYGPWFGHTWARLAKMENVTNKFPSNDDMVRGMSLSLLNAVLTSMVLSVLVQIWRPSTWSCGPDYDSKVYYGTVTAFVIWLGFYLPVGLNTLAWEGKP